ncbi:MAG: hypothetical protein Q9167_005798 [Letrouitia subvulpina]
MAARPQCVTHASKEVLSLRSSGLRRLATANTLLSGHNRWSKIKHDKGREDALRSRERSQWVEQIASSSKQNGPNPALNPELASIIGAAKKTGLPKASIERAIAKGQGISKSGKPLENLTLEALLPPSVSAVIECQTDNRARTLSEIRCLIKELGGTITPTSHMFERRGRVILEYEEGLAEEDAMELVINAGAVDMEIQDSNTIRVFTDPAHTASIARLLSASPRVKLKGYEMIWHPNPETSIDIDSTPGGRTSFTQLICKLAASVAFPFSDCSLLR